MPDSPAGNVRTETFTLTGPDLVRMQWAVYQWYVVLMAALLVGMGGVAFTVQKQPGVFLVVLGVLVVYLLVVAMSIRRYAYGPSTEPLRKPRNHVFSDKGIHTQVIGAGEGHTPWAQVLRVRQLRGFWLITYQSGAQHPVPFWAVAESDRARLQALFNTHA